MKWVLLFLALFVHELSFAADEVKLIAISDWSKPVAASSGHTLRLRMIVAQGRSAAFDGPYPETQFYLEFQNVSGVISHPTTFYFDPAQQLHCELSDINGKSPHVGQGGSGGGAGAAWITLPYDGTIRLRANMFGYGNKPGDGLQLTLWPPAQCWVIQQNDTNAYYLSGTLTVSSPSNAIPNAAADAWSGTFELPKMKISVPKS
jgi:hypothetical protein